MDNLTHNNHTSTSTDDEQPDSADRRRLLRWGGAAVAAGTAAALLRAEPGRAAPGDGLRVTSDGLGDAIVGEARNPDGGRGVVGTGIGGAGVTGVSRGRAPGVRALADRNSRGPALLASTDERANGEPAIEARQRGAGDGLYAHVDNAANSNRAVFGRTYGTGIAVVAAVSNPRSSASAAKGTTVGSGAGVEGNSTYGVGGKFSGRSAQVHLVPSSASSHPQEGAAGQLFVDRVNRLWYCRGGREWKRLA